MDYQELESDDKEAMAKITLLQVGRGDWDTCTEAERSLARALAEERWYREQAEAKLRAFGDAAQCFGAPE